jgi:voltage-gated potassium channel
VTEPDDPIERPAERWMERRAQRHELRRRGLRPRDAAYLIVGVWLVAVVLFGFVEHWLDDQTFPTAWLGMWWALQTVTTVGYGDVVPQDDVGRAIASLLLLGGLSLLSVITATITSSFVARAERMRPDDGERLLVEEIRKLREEIARLSGRPGAGESEPR